MKFELNDLTPLLDLLAQPAFCTEDGVVCYCNRPARDRGLKTGVSAASLLGAGAELPAPGGAPRQVILNLHDALASASVLPSESGYLFLLSPAVSESVPPQALLAAAPVPDPVIERTRPRTIIKGELPSPLNPPSGCVFHPRCPKATEECKQAVPAQREVGPGHVAACIHV